MARTSRQDTLHCAVPTHSVYSRVRCDFQSFHDACPVCLTESPHSCLARSGSPATCLQLPSCRQTAQRPRTRLMLPACRERRRRRSANRQQPQPQQRPHKTASLRQPPRTRHSKVTTHTIRGNLRVLTRSKRHSASGGRTGLIELRSLTVCVSCLSPLRVCLSRLRVRAADAAAKLAVQRGCAWSRCVRSGQRVGRHGSQGAQ